MGKKTKTKTTWRNLPIQGSQQCSDSEGSQVTGGSAAGDRRPYKGGQGYARAAAAHTAPTSRGYNFHRKQYNGVDNQTYTGGSGKHLRSCGTSAVNGNDGKITFNEDEYTRITTPRQDVLFKKGYLSRPRAAYSTQTSTGNSTSSASASTGHGTPDHLLPTPCDTDLDPEMADLQPDSPFGYPAAGYLSRDGLYFFNGFEPYPVLVYNAPQYCYELPLPPPPRCKRYSTDSMTESTTTASPHTEEHSHSGGEAPFPTAAHVTCLRRDAPECPNEIGLSNGLTEPRKLKKKRRRKLSKVAAVDVNGESTPTTTCSSSCSSDNDDDDADAEVELGADADTEAVRTRTASLSFTCPDSPATSSRSSAASSTDESKSQLKPDAKEFVPRSTTHLPPLYFQPQFHLVEFAAAAGIPPGAAAFLSHPPPYAHPLMLNYMIQPPPPPPPPYTAYTHAPICEDTPPAAEPEVSAPEPAPAQAPEVESPAIKTEAEPIPSESNPTSTTVTNSNNLSSDDIQEIVTKLEEAAKEQNCTRSHKTTRSHYNHQPQSNRKKYTSDSSCRRSVESSPMHRPQVPPIIHKTEKQLHVNKTTENTQQPRKQYNILFKPQSPSYQHKSTVAQTTSNSRLSPKKHVQQEQFKPKPQTANQWISVSNRKKRRGNSKTTETDEDWDLVAEDDQLTVDEQVFVPVEEIVVNVNHDGFEVYDVDKLVDVVPENKPIEKIIVVPELTKEAVVDAPIKQVEVVIEQPVQMTVAPVEQVQPEPVQDVDEIITVKKKVKKTATAKPVRRVMVTDHIEPVKTDLKPKELIAEKVVTMGAVEIIKKVKEDPVKKVEEKVRETTKKAPSETISTTETTPKSKAKKKKQPAKGGLATNTSTTSSTTTLNTLDDSYDFLLSSIISEADRDDKTNVEVSQELDMMIQRGMYSSLEEKIRSFNITASNDGFFKTINYYGPGKLNDTSLPGQSKDFSAILKDLKPTLSKISENKIDFTKLKVQDALKPQFASAQLNNGYQDFLGLGPDLHEPDKSTTATSAEEVAPTEPAEYPITKAVKDWISKTREQTPEVEILKSPTTIFREFNTDESLGDNEEELTLWTLSNQDSVQVDEDLLDCWENEPVPEVVQLAPELEQFVDVDLAGAGQGIEVTVANEEDEAMEVYESKYGKNEDFIKLQEELQTRRSCKSANGSVNANVNAMPGSLPYRAICCAIM